MNGDDFVSALGRHSLEASVLVGVVLAVQWVFRKQLGPQWSCALWLIVALRLLPISIPSGFSLFNWLPTRSTSHAMTRAASAEKGTLNDANSSRAETLLPHSFSSEEMSAADLKSGLPTDAARLASASGKAFPYAREWLFWAWLAGAVLLAGYVTVSGVPIAWRIARLRSFEDPKARRLLEACRLQLGLRSAPVLCEFNGIATPALYGVFRPRLLLPVGFTTSVSADELRFVFMHELAHLRRRDLLVNWFAAALLLLHWFNPIVWLSFARWRVDREIACDAMAIGAAGTSQRVPYGRTMLRLLEEFPVQASHAGLLGIFESKAALRRRIKMIAANRPPRKPFVAICILATLALMGLTDAQVNPATAPLGSVDAPSPLLTPHLRGESVVFLVQASESMLGQTAEDVARRRGENETLKRAAPKWVQTAETLQSLLEALAPGTRFQVLLFSDGIVAALPEAVIEAAKPGAAITRAVRQVQSTVPSGGSNLKLAFETARDLTAKPDRLVLLTDGLLREGAKVLEGRGASVETQLSLFHAARKQLAARLPVTTVLFSYEGLPWVPALFWELANSTRGVLVSPATLASKSPATEISHLAFVIDTSGSMRSFNTEKLWRIVVRMVEETLAAHPHLSGIKVFDSDGRPILGSADAWLPVTAGSIEEIKAALRTYDIFSESNPVPGLLRIVRTSGLSKAVTGRLAIYVLGDELSGSPETTLARIDELNPRDANGNRRAVINAIGFPTTIQNGFSMENTGVKFADFVRQLTHEHGGTFIALQDL